MQQFCMERAWPPSPCDVLLKLPFQHAPDLFKIVPGDGFFLTATNIS